ncbi:type I pullulanase [Clostridium sp. BJN0001]|uniref:type I pullulanase n=1 Tax=Clostridium sp. BJN0001 TaxID=2930219 RepID=UPI001FD087A1|nr:type I pullulanase [Clostridium sp. BJN0001]
MKQLKKTIALITLAVFFFAFFQMPVKNVNAAENTEKVLVKIRYNRQDSNYDGWNLWTWEKGKDGKQVDFIGQDDQGKFAIVEADKNSGELFYIVRKGDWKEKATGDESVDLTLGDTESIINDNDGNVSRTDKKINRDFASVKLNVHYYRGDENYDNWDVWSWTDDSDGAGYGFAKSDKYGQIAEVIKSDVKGKKSISFIVRKGGDSWTEKDTDIDRSVDLAYANNKGEINIYLVQGDEKVYTTPDQPIKKTEITSLKIETTNNINFKLNRKLDSTKGIILKENGQPINSDLYFISINKDGISGNIKTVNGLDLNKKYSVVIPGCDECQAEFGKIYDSSKFEQTFKYDGKLGAIYTPEKTDFVLWAPVAESVYLNLYGTNGKTYKCPAEKKIEMKKEDNGIWKASVDGDLDGCYYNYIVKNNGKENEVTDPYAKAVGVNGKRSMVVNLEETNPEGWNEDKRPELKNPTDATIYEMHIRDFSIDENSGVSIEYRGKYEGVWQKSNTVSGTDIKTGIDHLKELGINTVQIMPSFDFRSIDETKDDNSQYNWGYDPQNYSVPEGSYSMNPYDGKMRITEFKEMVKELHKNGIKVIMDVVYNHTGATEDSLFNLAVPDYYYRQDENGNFSNGSGCGNETASDRFMVRKLIVDSVKYWTDEYHIDGFRFDLMAVHDIDTMKEIRTELDKIDNKILLYGEGWTGSSSSLDSSKQTLKANMPKFGEMQIGAFSDDLRDGLRGNVFDDNDDAFLLGKANCEDTIKFGVVASTQHDGIDYSNVNYSEKPWANEPYQTINYASCHDNMTLWDKLNTTGKDLSQSELIDRNKMSAAIVLTSQGIPFMQAGEEFARTKTNPDGTFNGNSYNSPDSVNKLDWKRISEFSSLYDYYKGLLKLRSEHKAFRMDSTEDIQNNLKFLEEGKDFKGSNVVAYVIDGSKANDSWSKIAVMFNSSNDSVEVTLPQDGWVTVVNKDNAGVEKLDEVKNSKVILPAHTSYVLVDKESFEKSNS